jgi:DNA-binding transcriptional LysR family regulator
MLFFAEVAERGGFAAAGRALGLPTSRLSRRVAELEGRLGVRLLQRTTRRIALTDVGAQYLRHCVAVREEAQAAADVVAQVHTEPRGVLRVSCPVTLGPDHRRRSGCAVHGALPPGPRGHRSHQPRRESGGRGHRRRAARAAHAGRQRQPGRQAPGQQPDPACRHTRPAGPAGPASLRGDLDRLDTVCDVGLRRALELAAAGPERCNPRLDASAAPGRRRPPDPQAGRARAGWAWACCPTTCATRTFWLAGWCRCCQAGTRDRV